MTLHPSLQPILDEVESNEVDQFLFTCTINLYFDALRRKQRRTLFYPADTRNVIEMFRILVSVTDQNEGLPKARSWRPTEQEQAATIDPSALQEIAEAAVADAVEEPQAEPSARRRRG